MQTVINEKSALRIGRIMVDGVLLRNETAAHLLKQFVSTDAAAQHVANCYDYDDNFDGFCEADGSHLSVQKYAAIYFDSIARLFADPKRCW